MKKKIIFFLIVIIYLFFLISPVYGVNYNITEQYVIDYYNSIVNSWLVAFHNASDSIKSDFVNTITSNNYQVYFFTRGDNFNLGLGDIPNHNPDYDYIYCVLAPIDGYTFTQYATGGYHNFPDFVNYQWKNNNSTWYYYVINLGTGNFYKSTNTSSTFTVYGPALLWDFRTDNFTSYINNFGTATAQDVVDSINALNDNIMDDTVSSETEHEISDNVSRDNTTTFDSSVTSFFSNLTTLVSGMSDYNAFSDITIEIGLPFTTNTIVLHSNMIFSKLNSVLIVLIRSFWAYLFGFYVFKYINKLYISIKSGNILDGLSSNEVITNDML